jgi:N-acetylglucosaminyl-diphospho-decaprenol L-rhamnosyltransferase
MTSGADLSVIIVNWNSAEYVRKCLESIYAHTSGVSFEVIVVDNASFDTVDQIIARQFPSVRFIQLRENKGFAAANNAGFAIASGEVVCFLNPDTEVRSNVLAVMSEMVGTDKRIGVAGCRLLNTDLTLQTSCVLPFPSLANQLLDIEWLKRRTPRWNLWGMRAIYSPDFGPQEVDAVSGAFMVVPRHVFEDIKGFSEDYFMYSEDVDLCFRARSAGYTVVYNGGEEIIHHGGKSSDHAKESRFATVMMREAIARFFEKHKSKAYSEMYKRLLFVSAVVRLAAIAAASPILLFSHRGKEIAGMVKKWLWVAQWSTGPGRGSAAV